VSIEVGKLYSDPDTLLFVNIVLNLLLHKCADVLMIMVNSWPVEAQAY